MKNILLTILRVIALVIVYLILFILSSSLINSQAVASRLTPEQVALSNAMLPVVSLIMTLMLAYLALRSRWHGWKLAGALFAIFYGIYTFLSQIETMAFPAVSGQMPEGMVRGFFLAGLALAVPFSLAAVWILGKTRKDPTGDEKPGRLQMPASEWIWKLAIAAILYVVVYFTFGYYVAWRTPGLPEFYGGTDPGSFGGQMLNVMRDTPWLPVFQIFRGLIWAGIGCLILAMHKGPAWEAALAVGLSFAVLMCASLLFPNPYMPPIIARAHAIELLSSNFLYGILLSLLLLWKPSGKFK